MTPDGHDFFGGSMYCLRCEVKVWNRDKFPCVERLEADHE